MRDELDDLVAGDSVVERAPDVAADLVRPIERGQRGDGDEAAVPLREPRALAHIAEQHVMEDQQPFAAQAFDFIFG